MKSSIKSLQVFCGSYFRLLSCQMLWWPHFVAMKEKSRQWGNEIGHFHDNWNLNYETIVGNYSDGNCLVNKQWMMVTTTYPSLPFIQPLQREKMNFHNLCVCFFVIRSLIVVCFVSLFLFFCEICNNFASSRLVYCLSLLCSCLLLSPRVAMFCIMGGNSRHFVSFHSKIRRV